MTEPLSDNLLLTVFLRHDQSNNLEAVSSKLKEAKWWESFPPEGVKVVSWICVMSFGHIATLEVPASKLPAVNIELERAAWGVFRTECFPSYDFAPIRANIIAQRLKEAQ